MKENNTYQDGMDSNNLPDALRVTPFGVPENYFDELHSSILSQVKLELHKDQEDFEIPNDYFSNLQESILAKVAEEKIKNSVQSDGFGHPEEYFNTLQNNISARIAEEKLKDQVVEDGFTTSADYFESLNERIQSKIFVEDLKKISQQDGFEVPNQYFEELTAKLAKSIKIESDEEETPIHSIKKRRSWSKYAAAASLTAILGLGGYFGVQYSNNQKQQPDLANVSDQEIINYLAQTSTGDDLYYVAKYVETEDIENVNTNRKVKDEDIEEYLKYM